MIRYDLVDVATVEYLSQTRNLLPYKDVDGEKEVRWNEEKITSCTLQGIQNGDSIETMSGNFSKVLEMSQSSAVRNARTACTSCCNKAKLDRYEKLASKGVNVRKQWLATGDSRTRHTHIILNGVILPISERFENGVLYPADPDGRPEEVYNCRCTMVVNYPDIDMNIIEEHADDIGVVKEIQRRGGTEAIRKIINGKSTMVAKGHVIAEGKDISATWKRRNEFDFEIEDVINAQNFDGLPRVVPADEFDALVKESSFIAQCTYSASTQEILDEYRNMLYNGKWYVDCGTGGAQYGQGMYCAADYNGELTDGIQSEMQHYIDLNLDRIDRMTASEIISEFGLEEYAPKHYIETLTLDKSAKIVTYEEISKLKDETAQSFEDVFRDTGDVSAMDKRDRINVMDLGSFAALKGYDAINAEGHGASGSYTVVLNRTKLIIKEME